MMQVGIMGMAMHQRRVPVRVGVRFARRRIGSVLLLVMLVMAMSMLMLHPFVGVLVLVSLGDMQP
jgi:hypothetical protein